MKRSSLFRNPRPVPEELTRFLPLWRAAEELARGWAAEPHWPGLKLWHERAVELFDRSVKRLPTPSCAAGCRAACRSCCRQDVAAAPHEVLLIHEVLRGAAVDARTATGVCPLLAPDGRCSVYAVRPLNCRMEHSYSRRACEEDDSHPYGHEVFQMGQVTFGPFLTVAKELGLDTEWVFLIDGLRALQGVERAGPRWCGGARLFVGLERRPEGTHPVDPENPRWDPKGGRRLRVLRGA